MEQNSPINVLSLFDGISCARVALERTGIPVKQYWASEIDKYAIQISKNNWPEIDNIGDVRTISGEWTNGVMIDLLIGGSPCQDLSIAKRNREGLNGKRSGLFFEYVRILNETKPRYFILENVNSMHKDAKEEISRILGIEPIMINAALVSAQNRKRLFWVGERVGRKYIGVSLDQPEDRNIFLKDILENADTDRLKSYSQAHRVYDPEGKSVALQALGGGQGAKTGLYMVQTPRGSNRGGVKAKDGKTPSMTSSRWEHNNKLHEDGVIRKLTPIECERLQGLPDFYTDGVSNTQRYKCLGNAFNVDVIAHILSHLSF